MATQNKGRKNSVELNFFRLTIVGKSKAIAHNPPLHPLFIYSGGSMFTRTVSSLVLLAFIALGAAGCYHATVETGLTPSSEVIEESFASCWIYGLVPPKTISAQTKCKNGVAKVETQHSFVNGLVAAITLGIYTPISIKVTCAASGTSMIEGRNPDLLVEENATEEEVQAAFALAADRAVAENKPIYVKY